MAESFANWAGRRSSLISRWSFHLTFLAILSLGCGKSHKQVTSPPIVDPMVLISAGTFTMGSPPDEPGRPYQSFFEHQHQVTLSRAFYISKWEITQAEWRDVMGWNDSGFMGDRLPVDTITWFDALKYCNARSSLEGRIPVYTITQSAVEGNHLKSATVQAVWANNGYRLPTEAEWEYSCRAGSSTAFCNGPITRLECAPLDHGLDNVGWFCGNAANSTHEVGTKAANAWGLFDMHGNLWEWCWGMNTSDSSGAITDPPLGRNEAISPYFCAVRGGSWEDQPQYCRSAMGTNYLAGEGTGWIGFRVARSEE